MMNLYIPKVGEKIVLMENWTCNIYAERRNLSVFEALGIKVKTSYTLDDTNTINLTIPKDTVLIFDRLYIRKGDSGDFDSVTFKIENSPNTDLKNTRFWVKLDEANKIKFDFIKQEVGFNNLKDFIRLKAKELNIVNLHRMSKEDNEYILLEALKSVEVQKIKVNIDLEIYYGELLNDLENRVKNMSQNNSYFSMFTNEVEKLKQKKIEVGNKKIELDLNIALFLDCFIFKFEFNDELDNFLYHSDDYNYKFKVLKGNKFKYWNCCKKNKFDFFSSFGTSIKFVKNGKSFKNLITAIKK